MERFRDEAVVLSTVDYGEADRVVTMLTLGHGRLSAFANGARKSKRRFAGALEAGTWLTVQLVERRGDTMRLDAAEIRESFHHLRESLPLIARSLYCLELCRELTRDQEAHPGLFHQLLDYLRLLDARKAGPTSLIKFELDALAHAGFMPRFAPCLACGGPTGERPSFDAQEGGVLCAGCAPRAATAAPISPLLVEGMIKLQSGLRQPMEVEMRARARDLLNAFIAHHLGHRLKSAEFMEQVGTD